MKQITTLGECPFCGHKSDGSPLLSDSDYSEDNITVTDIWECGKCLQSWCVRSKAISVFITPADPNGVRDEVEIATVVDPQEG